MKLKPTAQGRVGALRPCRAYAGFTLAEVLAAMLFMAIVIPVTIHGLHIASLAGEVGQRKSVAMRIAERVLNELKVTGQLQNTAQNGVVQEGSGEYRWSLHAEPWSQDSMQVITVQVNFPVQDHDYDVRLSTLIPNATL